MTLGTLRTFLLSIILALAAVSPMRAQWIPLNPVVGVQQQSDGARIALKTGYLHLRVCTDSIVRVVYSLEAAVPDRPDFIICLIIALGLEGICPSFDARLRVRRNISVGWMPLGQRSVHL